MGFVRYSKINRSAKGETANGGDDRWEKSWSTKKKKKVYRRAPRGRRWQWGRGESKENGLRNLRFHLVARACPSRLSSRLDRGRGPRETRPPASRVGPPSFLGTSVLYWHRARSGAPEDAPGDPTSFQASALLQHSRVMLLDPGDPRGWLYSGHAGKTAASDGVTKGLACIAIYRALMINRQKRAASRDLMIAS